MASLTKFMVGPPKMEPSLFSIWLVREATILLDINYTMTYMMAPLCISTSSNSNLEDGRIPRINTVLTESKIGAIIYKRSFIIIFVTLWNNGSSYPGESIVSTIPLVIYRLCEATFDIWCADRSVPAETSLKISFCILRIFCISYKPGP